MTELVSVQQTKEKMVVVDVEAGLREIEAGTPTVYTFLETHPRWADKCVTLSASLSKNTQNLQNRSRVRRTRKSGGVVTQHVI